MHWDNLVGRAHAISECSVHRRTARFRRLSASAAECPGWHGFGRGIAQRRIHEVTYDAFVSEMRLRALARFF
jgi:hypothetical protein